MNLISIIKLLRPQQWTKNLFVFLPVFFNGQLLNVSALLSCFAAFTVFSLAASSIYCFNDIYDVETAAAVFMGASSFGLLDSTADLSPVLNKVVENMFGGKAATEREITSKNANNDEAVKKTADKVNRNMTRNIILGVVGAGLYIVLYVWLISAATNS